MKKLKFCAASIVLIALSFSSCEKEQVAPALQKEDQNTQSDENSFVIKANLNNLSYDGEFGVTDAQGMLIFRSSEDFYNLIDSEDDEKIQRFLNHISILNYVSLEASLGNNAEEKEKWALMLLKILNSEKTIAIGKHMYRLDLNQEKVFTMPLAAINEVNQLYLQNAMNKKIRAFSMHLDVVGEVEQTLFGGCGETCKPSDVQTGSESFFDGNLNQYIFDYKLRCRNFGILKDFYANVKCTKGTVQNLGQPNQNYTLAPYDWPLKIVLNRRYKRRCQDIHDWMTIVAGPSYTSDLTAQSYHQARCLSRYHHIADFYRTEGNDGVNYSLAAHLEINAW